MRGSFLPEAAKKERDIEAIRRYVKRIASAALARWVCYRFYRFAERDQYPDGGWSQEAVDDNRALEDLGGDYRGPMDAEELQAYVDEYMSWPIRHGRDAAFPGFAGHAVRPDELTFADYIGALPQRVAATLEALDPDAVSDICAFLRVAHGRQPLDELEFDEDDYAFKSDVVVEVEEIRLGYLASRKLTLFAFVPSDPDGTPVPIYNALFSLGEVRDINIRIRDLCAMPALAARDPEEAVYVLARVRCE